MTQRVIIKLDHEKDVFLPQDMCRLCVIILTNNSNKLMENDSRD